MLKDERGRRRPQNVLSIFENKEYLKIAKVLIYVVRKKSSRQYCLNNSLFRKPTVTTLGVTLFKHEIV